MLNMSMAKMFNEQCKDSKPEGYVPNNTLKIKLLQYHFEMVRWNVKQLAMRLIVSNILCSANPTGNADEQTPLVLIRTSTATTTTV